MSPWEKQAVSKILEIGCIPTALRDPSLQPHLPGAIKRRLSKRRTIQEALAIGGVDEELIVRTLFEILTDRSEYKDKNGKVHKIIDARSRLKAVELILRVRGDLVIQKVMDDSTKGVLELFES